MNKFLTIATHCFFTLFVLATTMTANPLNDLEVKVVNLNSSVDTRFTPEVKRQINRFTLLHREGTEIILGRVSLYFPLFEEVLREKGLPDDLKYLSIVESSLRPTATSHVGASGLWQFMKGTGRMLGLKITKTIDERRDPKKSTEAAAEYLQSLYDSFGDWTLALAAYNCGPGNVRKAIRRSGGKKSYWEIQRFLPKETRMYIPKFIAMSYTMNYYYEHNLVPIMPADELLNTAEAEVRKRVQLKNVSSSYNVSMATIKLLNPVYIRNIIPADANNSYTLKLPKNTMYDYVYDNYDHSKLLTKLEKSTRETINITSLTPYTIYKNHEEHGMKFKIAEIKPIMVQTARYKTTRIGIKESLVDVANRTGISLDQLLLLNNFSSENPPRVGSVVKIEQM